ncbi:MULTISPECIES: hypothetical protein [unclassified Modicisalibacter]|uniref:hypothetical protein n=1 Tax=unclassified Modicisalibacter TaxID=2679913 RepID=UPI001CCD3D5E|nr:MULTISPECIES: hypothetical protein [unclassified Modicisalibacter]MBZ9559035.1 hypothetical protein [Modicisalibacter sp. R2A 31.J]MBZ9576853.1 hypothetical protein [Modicisalibacter sp. MOD 31.J]
MAEILQFPIRAMNGSGIERYLTNLECLSLGMCDPFPEWLEVIDDWLEKHPQARTTRNTTLRSLLADTWLVFHMACDETGRLSMRPHLHRRWAQLQYHVLSDVELLVIVVDNLADIRHGVAELSQQYPPEVRDDLSLFGVEQGIARLKHQLERLLDPDVLASRQPEW